eukprot:GEMP01003549.1.p1 GENE.GEMP01003549.1~~GEMP01003549.1.p1  ORF type:complete len:1189 (+),score=306.65 GEMP01003549.1:502-4068(+)
MQGQFNTFHLLVKLIQAEHLSPAISTTGERYWNICVTVSFNGLEHELHQTHDKKDVTWNRVLRFPCTIPCWDNTVAVSIRHRGALLQQLIAADTLVGEINFITDKIPVEPMPPTWFYLYQNAEHKATNSALDVNFAGRVLLAADMERRVFTGSNNTVEERQMREQVIPPHFDKGMLDIKIYKICFERNAPLQKSDVEVRFNIRGTKLKAKEPCQVHGYGAHWAKGGLVDLVEVTVGADDHIFGFVWINTFDDSTDVYRHSYFHIPSAHLKTADLHWYELHSTEEKNRVEGVMLISAILLKKSKKKRPVVKAIKWKTYVLRSYVYGATNIPIKGPNIGTKISITLADAIMDTPLVYGKLHPVWDYTDTREVVLSDDVDLRSSLLISIVQERTPNSGAEGTDAGNEKRKEEREKWQVVGSLRLAQNNVTSTLPTSWFEVHDELEWMTVKLLSGQKNTKTAILCGFDLFEAGSYMPATPWKGGTETVKVPICVVGCRLTTPIETGCSARLSLCHTRKGKSKAVELNNSPIGTHHEFNYFEHVTVECRLPQFSNALDHLEVTIWYKDNEKIARVLGSASILLNSYYSTTTLLEKQQIEEKFRRKTDEQIRKDNKIADLHSLATNKKNIGVDETNEDEIPLDTDNPAVVQEYWMRQLAATWTSMGNMETMNCRASPLDTVDEICPLKSSQLIPRPETDDQQMMSEHNINNFSWQRIGKTRQRRTIELSLEEFLHQHADHGGSDAGRLFPLDEVPIWRTTGNDTKDAETVGVLLYVMGRISSTSGGHATGDQDAQQKADQLQQTVISGIGLVPHSGMGDANTFLRAQLGGHVVSDKHERTGSDPTYSSSFTFNSASFPQDSSLLLEVVEKPNDFGAFIGFETETVIGSTTINLEQRWLHKWFRKMMNEPKKDDQVPIEMRALHASGVHVSRGYISLWVEILKPEEKHNREVDILPFADSRYFVVRLAIHKVVKIAFIDGDPNAATSFDCQIQATMTGNDKVAVTKSTDVHRGVDKKDPTATYNWRLVFRVAWPLIDPTLQIVLWDRQTIGGVIPLGREPVAECALDLEVDFLEAAKRTDAVILALDYLKMSRPRESDKTRALLVCELTILPEELTDSNAAGEGRDEPNKDPFLDPLDEHLQRGRPDMVVNFLEAVKNIGGWTLFWLKWGTVLYTLGSLLAALIAGIIVVVTTLG